MSHKFQIKRTEVGYVSCCGHVITKITKDVDPDMYGSVNWYFANLDGVMNDNPFYTLSDLRIYLGKLHDANVENPVERWMSVMARADATLAKYNASKEGA